MATIVTSSGDTATMTCCSLPPEDFVAPDAAVKKLYTAIAEATVKNVDKAETSFIELVKADGEHKEGTKPYYIRVWKLLHFCRGSMPDLAAQGSILEAIHRRYTVLLKENADQAREIYLRLLHFVLKHSDGELPVEVITRVSVAPIVEVRGGANKYPLQRGTILHMAASTHYAPILTIIRDAIAKTEGNLYKSSHDNIENVDLTVQTEPVVRVNARIAARFLYLQMLYSRTYESGLTAFYLCNDKDGLRLLYQDGDKERGKFLRYLDVDPVYNMYITQRRERMLESSLDRKSSLEDITTEGRNIDPESGIIAIEGFFRYVQNTPLLEVPSRDGVIPINGNEVLAGLPSGTLLVD